MNYTIKNFRVFDSEGDSIDIQPITVLTGCNSSGKSSIVKSILLLNDFLSNVKYAVDNNRPVQLDQYKIDFTKPEIKDLLLGNFDKLLNNNSTDKTITFEYETHSYLLSENIIVTLVFMVDEKDELKNGYLKQFEVRRESGEVLYASGKGKGCSNKWNFSGIVNHFLMYVLARHILVKQKYELYEDEPENKDVSKSIEDYCDNLLKKEEWKSLQKDKQVPFMGNFDLLSEYSNKKSYIIEKTIEYGTLFYMPLWDWLKNVPKGQTETIIKRKIDKNKLKERDPLGFAFEKVMRDFKESECDTLLDYFKKWAISSFSRGTNESNSPCVFNGMGIDQSYLESSPWTFSDSPRYTLCDDYSWEKESEEERKKRCEREKKAWKRKKLDFGAIYATLLDICYCCGVSDNDYYHVKNNILCAVDMNYRETYSYVHSLYKMFGQFCKVLIQKALEPEFLYDISYISSSRIAVKRLYSFDEKDGFSKVLLRYFDEKRQYENTPKHISSSHDYQPCHFINTWLKNLGIAESIKLELDKDGLGVKPFLCSDNGRCESLADKGYGISQVISILLQIEIEAVSYWKRLEYNLGIEFIKSAFIAVEEPEIHLHPKYQSLLADMFIEANKKYNIKFIIETHSEYLIRKLQTRVADKTIDAKDVSLNYVELKDGAAHVKKIGINEDGRLKDTFGSGFFDEADNLSMELLSLKAKNNG